jgi:HPt (histidine-containing phosphotransfer) domain-containing protein
MHDSIPMQSPSGTTQDLQPSQADVAWTAEVLSVVWERQQERVHCRIDLVERAVAALAEDRLDIDLRADAERAAHMLAGSLGMFGFIDASDAARELQSELAQPVPERAHVLSALLRRLRSGIRGPVALCGTSSVRSP